MEFIVGGVEATKEAAHLVVQSKVSFQNSGAQHALAADRFALRAADTARCERYPPGSL